MPWRTLCGFPPTAEPITLRLPFKEWRPDTVITDTEGNEMFVLLDQTQEMRSYEAIFGDLEGRRLCCVKRHLRAQFWKDGFYLCTYEPNYRGQRALSDRDIDNKRVYPFSYLQISPMKGRFYYRLFDNQEGLFPPCLKGENAFLGFMNVCATPAVRTGRWACKFKRVTNAVTAINVDMWKNRVIVGPGVDMLAALCISYIFDRFMCQPLITVLGRDPEDEYEYEDDEHTIDSRDQDGEEGKNNNNPYKDSNVDDYDDDDGQKQDRDGVNPTDPYKIYDEDDDDDDYAEKNRTNQVNRNGEVDLLDSNNDYKDRTTDNNDDDYDDDKIPDLLDDTNTNLRNVGNNNTNDLNGTTNNTQASNVDPNAADPYSTNWLDDGQNNRSAAPHQDNTTPEDPYSDAWLQEENARSLNNNPNAIPTTNTGTAANDDDDNPFQQHPQQQGSDQPSDPFTSMVVYDTTSGSGQK